MLKVLTTLFSQMNNKNKTPLLEDLPRRPNPPNWTPPASGSRYNPYDPHDLRPPQGYPSEFNTPGKLSSITSQPGSASSYQHMKKSMKVFGYDDPRPYSSLYPGQRKILKRVYNYDKFYYGVKWTGTLAMGGIVIYSLFIHRWNDGYENVFSDTYRLKLRLKYLLTGGSGLTEEEKQDLSSVKSKPEKHKVVFNNNSTEPGINSKFKVEDVEQNDLVLERPQAKHYIEAQRILAKREEKLLRSLDLAEVEAVSEGAVPEAVLRDVERGMLHGSTDSKAGKKVWWSFW